MSVWGSYLDDVDWADPAGVRPGCEPRLLLQPGRARHAIVLVHGLSDSPHFMRAIAARFFAAGWNAYLPLLHMHGLSDPQGMKGVSLEEWKRNVGFAVKAAQRDAEQVSIGGLSTGGALAVYEALRPGTPIDGAIFLFAAALELYRPPVATGLRALLKWLGGARRSNNEGPAAATSRELIGANPYRYERVEMKGARQLIRLIRQNRALLSEHEDRTIGQPVFAAHSELDQSADIRGVERLVSLCAPDRARFFRLSEADSVLHAEVVLEENVCAEDVILERCNPRFDEMMIAAVDFAETRLSGEPAAQAPKSTKIGEDQARSSVSARQSSEASRPEQGSTSTQRPDSS